MKSFAFISALVLVGGVTAGCPRGYAERYVNGIHRCYALVSIKDTVDPCNPNDVCKTALGNDSALAIPRSFVAKDVINYLARKALKSADQQLAASSYFLIGMYRECESKQLINTDGTNLSVPINTLGEGEVVVLTPKNSQTKVVSVGAISYQTAICELQRCKAPFRSLTIDNIERCIAFIAPQKFGDTCNPDALCSVLGPDAHLAIVRTRTAKLQLTRASLKGPFNGPVPERGYFIGAHIPCNLLTIRNEFFNTDGSKMTVPIDIMQKDARLVFLSKEGKLENLDESESYHLGSICEVGREVFDPRPQPCPVGFNVNATFGGVTRCYATLKNDFDGCNLADVCTLLHPDARPVALLSREEQEFLHQEAIHPDSYFSQGRTDKTLVLGEYIPCDASEEIFVNYDGTPLNVPLDIMNGPSNGYNNEYFAVLKEDGYTDDYTASFIKTGEFAFICQYTMP